MKGTGALKHASLSSEDENYSAADCCFRGLTEEQLRVTAQQ